VVIDDVFVPVHRTLSFNDVSALRCPGQLENTAPLYKLPFGTVFSYTIATPVIGMATGAYNAHLEQMRERVRISYGGQKVAGDAFAHVRVARAASDIDASWLQLERNLDEEMRFATAGEEIPMELRARARRDQVTATERCVGAIALLFKNSGGHALKNGNTIERAWRDANAGSVHAANDTERWLAMYGTLAFGLPIEDAMV
jgi:3-hydroxy-9,10-secoandrosta-1,3,5(10)-triene-9,17-dione monooxygenase